MPAGTLGQADDEQRILYEEATRTYPSHDEDKAVCHHYLVRPRYARRRGVARVSRDAQPQPAHHLPDMPLFHRLPACEHLRPLPGDCLHPLGGLAHFPRPERHRHLGAPRGPQCCRQRGAPQLPTAAFRASRGMDIRHHRRGGRRGTSRLPPSHRRPRPRRARPPLPAPRQAPAARHRRHLRHLRGRHQATPLPTPTKAQ